MGAVHWPERDLRDTMLALRDPLAPLFPASLGLKSTIEDSIAVGLSSVQTLEARLLQLLSREHKETYGACSGFWLPSESQSVWLAACFCPRVRQAQPNHTPPCVHAREHQPCDWGEGKIKPPLFLFVSLLATYPSIFGNSCA